MARPRGNRGQVRQCHITNLVGNVRIVYTQKIVDSVHAAREFRFGQNPAAAQPAQAINLRQAAGDHKLRTQMKAGRRRLFEERVEIHFVDQHVRANPARDRSDLSQRSGVQQNTARIVEIS